MRFSTQHVVFVAVLLLAIVCGAWLWHGGSKTAPIEQVSTVRATDRSDIAAAEATASTPAETRREISKDRSLDVSVLDESHSPVPDAAIELESSVGNRLQGKTDSRGHLALRLGDGESGQVAVSHDGFVSARKQVPSQDRGELQFVLQRDYVLSGKVTTKSGASVGAGVHVLAHPTDQPVPKWNTKTIGAAPTSSQTSKDGSFVIHGVSSGAKYRVFAGGNGFVLTEAIENATTSQPVDVMVDRLYGSLLTLLDQDGEPLHAPRRDVFTGITQTSTSDTQAKPLTDITPSVILAGVDPELDALPEHLILYLFSSSNDKPSIGPNHFVAQIPGYLDLSTLFTAAPVLGQVKEVAISMTRVASGWGSILVEFACQGCPEDGTNQWPRGELELIDDHGKELRYTLVKPTKSLTVPSVPKGSYKARFRSRFGYAFPPDSQAGVPLEVSESIPRFEVKLADTSTVTVTIRLADGTEYSGPFQGVIGKGKAPSKEAKNFQTQGARSLAWTQGPYRIDGLSAGTYSVRVFRPKVLEAGPLGFIELEVHPKTTEALVLTLDESKEAPKSAPK